MNEKMVRKLKWLCYTALFVCICWFLYVCFHSYAYIFNTEGQHIHLEAGSSIVGYTISLFAIHLILTFGLIGICVAFFINILRGLRREELFPKANILVINIGAILIFLQTMTADNFSQIFISEGPGQIVLTSNPFVWALAVLVFGAMYKIANNIAVEHDLTI